MDAPPTLVISTPTESILASEIANSDGITVTVITSESKAKEGARVGEYDPALLLPEDADDQLRTAGRIAAEYLVNDDTTSFNRAVLSSAITDRMRELTGQESAINVDVEVVGGENYIPIEDRVLPLLIIYAIVIAALFVPAAALMDERSKGTLDALLVTPASFGEVLIAKGIFGGILAMTLGWITLAINGVLGTSLVGVTAAMLLGTVILVQIGLILGMTSKDMSALYTWIKAGGILIVLPALVFLFPGIPQWIGQITPTYYFLAPMFAMSVEGETLSGSWTNLTIALLLCLILVPIVIKVANWSRYRH